MEDDEIYYCPWDRNYRYHNSFGDYIISDSMIYSRIEDFNIYPTEQSESEIQYEARTKKLEEILNDVILDFSGGLKLIQHLFTHSKKITGDIKIEGSNKKTTLTYNPETHEIGGFVWMSLGDRDLTEVTEEEVGIIRRALLIWIYENI